MDNVDYIVIEQLYSIAYKIYIVSLGCMVECTPIECIATTFCSLLAHDPLSSLAYPKMINTPSSGSWQFAYKNFDSVARQWPTTLNICRYKVIEFHTELLFL